MLSQNNGAIIASPEFWTPGHCVQQHPMTLTINTPQKLIKTVTCMAVVFFTQIYCFFITFPPPDRQKDPGY